MALPILVAGAVAPYALRLAVHDVERAGTVSGRLYAISTLGSLLGTFSSALLFIPLLGTRRTFLVFALALVLIAVVGLARRALVLAPIGLGVLLALPAGPLKVQTEPGARVIHEAETEYQYARVVQDTDGTRSLELNEGQAVHSVRRPASVLTGGIWDDGVEIDGALTDIGRRYFDLRNPRLTTHTADARPFLRRTRARYDAIFVDAYRQPYIPFYLTTKEFFALARSRLRPGGVVIVNAGHPENSDALERVLAATLASVFPTVLRDPAKDVNTLLLATMSGASGARLEANTPGLPRALRPLALAAARRAGPPLAGGRVYTDDVAPVEWLIDASIVEVAARGERGR